MGEPGLSISDFMTDGSLARLCEAAHRLTGERIALRDAAGRVVVGVGRSGPGEGDVRVLLDPSSAHGPPDELAAMLTAGPNVFGALVIAARGEGRGAPGAEARAETERFLTLLAGVVSEVCDRGLELQARVDELDVLYRLSSMLAGAGSPRTMAVNALRWSVEAMGVDAGAVRLLSEDGRTLEVVASVGLSEEYLSEAGSLPAREAMDRAALKDEVVAYEDILRDAKPVHPRAIEAEGLRSAISAGLVFRGQALGVVRLYTHERRKFTVEEGGLIQSIAQQLAAAIVNARLTEAEARGREVKRQVRLAREVQQRMLPTRAPTAPGIDVAARCVSCFDLGGDFYDIFDQGGALAVAVGDVVGKGVAAALLMSAVRSSIRAFASQGATLDEVIGRANEAMCRDTLESEFATLFYAVIDPVKRRMTYCNAGHEPALVVRRPARGAPTAADMDELRTGGMVIGVDPTQRYQCGTLDLRAGDALLLYSDGLSDAMNFDGKKFGRDRVRRALLDALAAEPSASAERVAAHLIWEMRRFAGLRTQTDDVTMVVVRVT